MKTKKLLFTFIAIIAVLLYSPLINAQANNSVYSIKNRWTIKASVSQYRTAFDGDPFMYVGDFFYNDLNRRMINFKVETNYGITKFMEIGFFTGFQHYEWINENSETKNLSFAPLFGANLNFHVLPFFVKSPKCNWDLYLTAKYGGCFLPHKEWESPSNPYSKYRHEYGLGLGIGYYIKNIIGIFVEGSIGQFALFPSMLKVIVIDYQYTKITTSAAESNFSFRIGIAAKIK